MTVFDWLIERMPLANKAYKVLTIPKLQGDGCHFYHPSMEKPYRANFTFFVLDQYSGGSHLYAVGLSKISLELVGTHGNFARLCPKERKKRPLMQSLARHLNVQTTSMKLQMTWIYSYQKLAS